MSNLATPGSSIFSTPQSEPSDVTDKNKNKGKTLSVLEFSILVGVDGL